MKKIFIAVLVMAAAATTMLGKDALSISCKYKFAATTPLATGNWVRICINGSGVYEITDEELRAMGFSDPSKVRVYGTGGNRRNINFLDLGGNRLNEDAVQPVPMQRAGGKLLFYGVGDRRLDFCTQRFGETAYPRYKRADMNTWSEKTYYMLTDSHPGSVMETAEVSDKNGAARLEEGYACIYHEKDIVNGLQDAYEGLPTGDLWWGETIKDPESPLQFDIEAKYYVPDGHVSVYADFPVFRGFSGQLQIGLVNKANPADPSNSYSGHSLNKQYSTLYTFDSYVAANKLIADGANIGRRTLQFSTTGSYYELGVLAVDYWTLVYPTSFSYIPSDSGFSQFEAGFNMNGKRIWCHTAPAGTQVWDITTPTKPFALDIENGLFYSDKADERKVVVFDPSRQMRRVEPGFERISNRNLHALASDPWDMLIITVEEFRPYAERLARLHRETDGQRVAVATAQEIYDEFNAGTPDPMAYRMLAKMLFQHPDRTLRNVLLMGPLYGDFRNIAGVTDRPEGLIAYEDNFLANILEISNVAMDYYGIVADNMRNSNRMDSAPISLGVGLLPIENGSDAELILAKIRGYLDKKDFSGIVNETYCIGCEGDVHLHENQSINMGVELQRFASENLGSKFAHETLWMENNTFEVNRVRIQEAMRRGKAFIGYHGHASASGITGFSTHDAMHAGNSELGLAFFGGCDLTYIDYGVHGMGDMPVIRSKNGFIGIIGSTRSVMSNQNELLGQNLIKSLFYDLSGKPRLSTPTMGEVYADAKDRTSNNSSISYIYVGDPSLRVPLALTKVKLDVPSRNYKGGGVVPVTGVVTDVDGNTLSDYEGYVTVKLHEPARMVVTPDDGAPTKMKDFEINDFPILSVKGVVRKGRFSVSVPLPADADGFLSDNGTSVALPLLVGTWDNDKKLGGSGYAEVVMGTGDQSSNLPAADADNIAPVIAANHNQRLGVIEFSVSDNVGVLPGIGAGSALWVAIDGKEMSAAASGMPSGTAVNSYSASLDISTLEPGDHSLMAVATDMSGNASVPLNMKLNISEVRPLELSTLTDIAIDTIDFRLSGGDGGEHEFLVTDRAGKVISRSVIAGADFSLDTSDRSKIPAGMYYASVRRNSPEGEKVRSNSVQFIVID